MGKEKISSSSANEKSNLNLSDSKKQINQFLLQSANLTSKNQLLKSGLINNELQHILNKMHKNSKYDLKLPKSERDANSSDSTDSESENKKNNSQLSKKKISNIIKKSKRKETVSSSSESSEEENLPTSLNIKKENVSASDESALSDEDNKSTTITKKDAKRKNRDLERSNSKAKKLRKHLSQIETSTADFSDGDEMNGMFQIGQMKKTSSNVHKQLPNGSGLDSSGEEESSEKGSLHDFEEIMENVEKKIEKRTQSERLSDSSFKDKVNVLQNICLTPPKLKSPKEKLKELYPGIKQIKNNMTLDFSNTEDVYLFRIPKNINPSSLENVEVNLEKKCKVNIGEKYNIIPTPESLQPTLVISDDCKILNFKGNIRMEKYIKSKKEPCIVVPEKMSVPLPDNLKKRHPLFGPDYRQKIKLSEQVEQKLDAAIESLLKQEEKLKKRKLKKTLKCLDENADNKNETIFTLLKSHSLPDTNKNIKTEASDDSAFCSSSSTEKMNKTSNRKYTNDTLHKVKSEVLTENESDHLEYTSPKKKKKNKTLSKSWEETVEKKGNKSFDDKEIKLEKTYLNIPDHDNQLINSTLIPGVSKMPSFNSEVSGIIFDDSVIKKTHKKSKKRSKSDDERSLIEKQLISDVLDSLKSDLNPPKKTKKKKTPVVE